MEYVDYNEIHDFVENIFYNDPELGFVKSATFNETGYLTVSVYKEYVNDDYSINTEQAVKDYFEFKERLSSLFMNFDDDMSDVEKVLAVHDWVVRETNYDYENYNNDTVPIESHYEEGVFEYGRSVCSGYAYAIIKLLQMEGIECSYVSAPAMNHGWVLVKLGDYYYHVDATWDDEGKDDSDEGYITHNNFLCSDAQIHATLHYDYPEIDGDDEQEIFKDNKRRTFNYYDGYWYSSKWLGNIIYKENIDGSTSEEWITFEEDLYNTIIYKDLMFVATPTKVYQIDMNNPEKNPEKMTVIFDADVDGSGSRVSEISIFKDNLKIDTLVNSKTISLKKESTISINKTSVSLTEGDSVKLTATATSPYGSKVEWASTNPAAVLVDDNGNITAKDGGEAKIIASIDGVMAECTVTSEAVYEEGEIVYKIVGDTLTISGKGAMEDYESGEAPWKGSSYDIKNVVVEEGITHIGAYSFEDMDNINNVKLPDTLLSIGDYSFYECDNLPAIDIPDSVTSIGDYAFRRCYSLEDIVLPDSLIYLGEWSLESTSITEIAIPSGISDIKEGTFYSCSKLVSVSLPQGLKTIGNRAFLSCESLESIDIPDSVTTIGETAFGYCYALKGITLSKALSCIGDNVFADCTSLVKVELPDSMTEMGDSAFYGCSNLEEIWIPEGVNTTDFGNYFFGCSEKLTIYGVEGSSIHTYAVNNGYKFVSTETTLTVVYGDANGDGVVDSKDAVLYKKYMAGCTGLEINLDACDVNGDDTVDSKDIVKVLQYMAGFDVELGAK